MTSERKESVNTTVETKAWWKEAVIYQIYPRSFADSNGDGIGDLNGIRSHLDYLEKLGVDVLWLSPVYQSPNDDNGYDISDYRSIMTEFGTMEDFDQLLADAHAHHLKIVMDLVVNHTSDEHAWFTESRKSKDNPYRDYYIWKDGKKDPETGELLPPNNWGACFGGSAWQYDGAAGMFYLHSFSVKQPDLNWDNPVVRSNIFSMMDFWCQKGIDGFRMDVINMISKDPSFPDGKITNGLYGDSAPYICSGPHVHEYLREMNQAVLSRYPIMTVGETPNVTCEEAQRYACTDGSELNMVFQFEHVNSVPGKFGKWTDEKPSLPVVRRILNKWQIELEGKAWNSLYLDNHDQPRAVSRFGCDSPAFRTVSAKMLATCLHMMKGTPYVYQGEELGMTNIHMESTDEFRDIESINAYRDYAETGIAGKEEMLRYINELGRDNARTPMQWTDGPQAGFTAGTPWIEVNPNYTEINAASETEDPDSVFSYFQELIRLRHTTPVIVYGVFRPLLEDSESIYAYERVLDGTKLTCICNFTDREIACPLDDTVLGSELITNYHEHKKGSLQPYEARVFLGNI